MIKTIRGNLLTEVTKGIIVHGCNMQGVMGAGIAKQIKATYPKAFDEYLKVLVNPWTKLGDVNIVMINYDPLYIANAFTQETMGADKNTRYCSYDAIADAFKRINSNAFVLVNSDFGKEKFPDGKVVVAFPKIGAGLANGNWNIIERIIDEALDDDFIEKQLYVLE